MRITALSFDAEQAGGLLALLPAEAERRLILLGCEEAPSELAAADVTELILAPAIAPTAEPAAIGRALESELTCCEAVVVDSTQSARDLAGWMAGALGSPIVWAIDGLRKVGRRTLEADRVVLDGGHRLVHRLELGQAPGAIIAKVVPAMPDRGHSPPTQRELSVTPIDERVERAKGVAAGEVSLAGAEVVISVGRGIAAADNVPLFAELSNAAGAALGATRAVVDAGWLPFSRQIGQTGAAVAPRVYIGFGVSGAVQHLAGMTASSTIVAVNTDATSPLCRAADLVVEADAVETARRLLDRLSTKENHQ